MSTRSLERVILEFMVRELQDNLLAIFGYDEAFSCSHHNLPFDTEASFIIVTSDFINDLISLKRSLMRNLPRKWRNLVNLEFIQIYLFKHFYEQGIYPALNSVLNGKRIYLSDRDLLINLKNFRVTDLSVNYLLCRGFYRLNHVFGNPRIALRDVQRHLFYLIKYSLLALLLKSRRIVLDCWIDILAEINKDYPDLCQLALSWLNETKSSLIKGATTIKHYLISLASKPYEIFKVVWELTHNEELIKLQKVLKNVIRGNQSRFEFICLFNKPTIIIYLNEKEERLPLVKKITKH